MFIKQAFVPLLGMVLAVGLTGCGEAMAPVKGTVHVNGSPAKGGSLVFAPIAESGHSIGRSATAEIKPDGSYSLTTEHPDDGARVGHYRVVFTPPAQELTEKQRTDRSYKAPPPLYMGMKPKPAEVEVKSGPNTIDLELVPAGK